MVLPTNIDATYPNASAADGVHQQYHDEIHVSVNAVVGAYNTAVAGGFVGSLEDWLDQVGSLPADAMPKSLVDAKGDLLAGSAADTVARLAAGTDGHVLTADAAAALGVKWAAPSGGAGAVATDSIFDAKGDVVAGTGADAAVRVAVGTNGQVLTADSAAAAGVKWAAAGGSEISDVIPGSANIGGTPPASGFVIQAGTSVVTLASNVGTVSYPSAFATGVLTIIAINGDSSAQANALYGVQTITTSGFTVRASVASGGYRINWWAIGW